MPRYTTVTPTFNPIDYATRIAPLQEYKQEYDKRAEKLEEQAALADTIGGLIDENKDPRLAGIYKDYMNNMNNVATNLLQTGDLGANRAALYGLRQDYNNKLKPIQQAYNDRAEDAKLFNTMKAKDPSYIGKNPLEHSLEDYLNGKAPNDKHLSGATLYELGMKEMQAASSRNFRETAWRLDKNLGGQFFSRIQATGWSQKEVGDALNALANSSDANISNDARTLLGFLANARNGIRNMTGVPELNDERMIAEADNWILRGLISGIGYKQTDKQLNNGEYISRADRQKISALRGRTKTPKTKTDSYRTNPLSINGKNAEVAQLAAKATEAFDRPIKDEKTGRVYHNALEAYYALSEAKKKYSKDKDVTNQINEGFSQKLAEIERRKGLVGYERYSDPEWMRVKSEQSKAIGDISRRDDSEYKRIKDLLGDYSISDGEYNKIKDAFGFTGDRMSANDIDNVVKNNWDFVVKQNVNAHNIAQNSPFFANLKKDIAARMEAIAEQSGDVKDIFRTDNGVSHSGKAIKFDEDKFKDENIISIDVTPFGIANREILVTTKDGKYLVPARYFGKEISGLYNAFGNDFNQYLTGKQDVTINVDDVEKELSIDDILTWLDPSVHDLAANTQRLFGHNFYQPQGGTSGTYPTGDDEEYILSLLQ